MNRFLFTTTLIAVLCASPMAAQSQLSKGSLRSATAVQHGTYSMANGFELSAPSYRSGPETIFDSASGPSYYYLAFAPTEEWVDEAAFARRGILANEQINGFDFAYCSTLPDPFGDGVTVVINLYTDTVQGSGPSSYPTPECAYMLAVPGDTSGLGLSCWALTVDLEGGFECTLPQEAAPGGGSTTFIGMGLSFLDATGWTNSGPMLGGTPGYGSQDYLEQFDGGIHQGTIFFGGNPQANFPITLHGNGVLDTSVVNANTPLAGDVLVLSSDLELRTGNQVTWSLRDPGTAGVAYAMVIGTAGNSVGFGGLAGAGTNLLIDPGSVLMPPTPLGMSGVNPSVQTPVLPNLPPVIMAQAFGFSGGIGIGNAVEASNALMHLN